MKKLFSFCGVALLGLAISAGSALANTNVAADPCPSTGNAQYCNEIIFISSTGAVTTYTSSGTATDGTVNYNFSISSNPYDGSDDQLIGVIDEDAAVTVNSLGLTGSGITGFDGDGANSGGAACVNGSSHTYSCNGSSNTLDASNGNTGYAGFDSTSLTAPVTSGTADNYFTSFTNPGSSAIVNFNGGLVAGDSAWFSLEAPATAGGLGVTVNPSTPEPGAPALLLCMGLALGLGGKAKRKFFS